MRCSICGSSRLSLSPIPISLCPDRPRQRVVLHTHLRHGSERGHWGVPCATGSTHDPARVLSPHHPHGVQGFEQAYVLPCAHVCYHNSRLKEGRVARPSPQCVQSLCVWGGGEPLWTSRHNSLAFLMYYSAPNLHAPVRCLCIDGCVQSSAGTCIPPTCNWVGPRSCTPMAWPTKSSTTTTTVRRAYTHTPVCRLCLGPCSLDASLHVRLCRLRSRPICFARFL